MENDKLEGHLRVKKSLEHLKAQLAQAKPVYVDSDGHLNSMEELENQRLDWNEHFGNKTTDFKNLTKLKPTRWFWKTSQARRI